MLSQKMIIATIVSLGLLFAVPKNNVLAQIPHETHTSATEKTSEFEYVQQSLWVKAAVTASILGLIGLEIWWFLLSKPKAKKVQFPGGIQEFTITKESQQKNNKKKEI